MELSKKNLELIQRFAEGKTCNILCNKECIFNSDNKNSIGLKCINMNNHSERTEICIDYLKKLKAEKICERLNKGDR